MNVGGVLSTVTSISFEWPEELKSHPRSSQLTAVQLCGPSASDHVDHVTDAVFGVPGVVVTTGPNGAVSRMNCTLGALVVAVTVTSPTTAPSAGLVIVGGAFDSVTVTGADRVGLQ